jgi:hypothetical protein
LNLNDLPPDEPADANSPLTFGSVTWQGSLKFFRTSPGSATRQKLQSVLLAFVSAQRKKKPKEFSTETITAPDNNAKAVDIELAELLRDPKSHDRQRVRVSGYYHQEFESCSLSISKEAFDNNQTAQAVWIGTPSPSAKAEDINYKSDAFLTVEGTFSAGPEGHLGSWPGAIRALTKVAPK